MLEFLIHSFQLYFQGAILPALLMGLWLWKADNFISRDGAEKLFLYINSTGDSNSGESVSDSLLRSFERLYNISKSPGFFLNVLYITFISIFSLLLLYSAIFAGGNIFQRQAFMQMIPLGLITYWSNLFGFLIHSGVSSSIGENSFLRNTFALCVDIGAKCLIFIILYGLYYLYLADFGPASSVGACSYGEALQFVPRILIEAVKFQNFSAVFLYSLFFSSFPLYLLFFISMMERHEGLRKCVKFLLFWLPFKNKPLRVGGTILSVLLCTFSMIAAFLLRAIPHETVTIIC